MRHPSSSSAGTTTAIALLLMVGYSLAFAPTSRNLASLEQLRTTQQQQPQSPLIRSRELSRLHLFAFIKLNRNNNDNGKEDPNHHPHTHLGESKDDSIEASGEEDEEEEAIGNRRQLLRRRVKSLAKQMISPMPKAIAHVLRDATMDAVDLAVEEVINRKSGVITTSSGKGVLSQQEREAILSQITLDLVNDAFAPMERSLIEMEVSLEHARAALTSAKSEASSAIEAIQAAALASAEGAANVVQVAEEEAERKVINEIYAAAQDVDDVEALRLEDIDFTASEMAPPFLDEAQCLIPGEPVVRVEKAPENSRRIFAGIDIMASVDDVWNILTQYDNLQNVVPNLVVNKVMDTYDGVTDYHQISIDASQSDQEQCREMADQLKGALLKQVGGAKVAGINFSARTTLEVREWPQGLPDFAHYQDEMWQGKSRDARAKEYMQTKLERYQFPRPFAVSSLPTKDISMQSIVNDDGEFRLYQGVWRMQPLPGCGGGTEGAMRLTYAVEISPRAYLPVQLVEGRIVKDLCNNLLAIRDCVEQANASEQEQNEKAAAMA
ncbi:Polyketide cyclase / dehydrase and lipid transport [Seminavis robusta]|uniref:Polyketide cyclase / dehydrase and lipid transport n=1 Tax=Seminavis robusta TaxID=568900 RepID=A0A9N8DFZ2_9STRA|nr:Polyketide cyclase / dehydrase and lipid transport [Seminavis robusta]|eukprot:Sro73_g040240.1 Polyketide cyclase / dehydrase and lipid transport (552) ;mRNA; r:18151-19995